MLQNSTIASSDEAGPSTDSESLETLEEEEASLPMYICINPRSIVTPEQIDLNEIAHKCKANNIGKQNRRTDQTLPVPKTPLALPKYPLTLMWNPAVINFELQYDRVVNRLRIFNSCIQPIYVQIFGLWDQTARLGASWCCRPRTRILLAPGMMSYLAISATPREESPVQLAHVGLQLSAAHMRDIVVGYFYVPMKVKFLNFKTLNCTEVSMSDFPQADGCEDSKGTSFTTSTELATGIDGSVATFNK